MYTARLHMRCLPDVAMRHFGGWLNGPVPAVSLEHHPNSWITLHLGEYSLESVDTQEWLRLGKHVDLFFESFSTSLAAGELLVILAGEVRRHIMIDSDHPDYQINVGRLRYEDSSPMNNWSDIWTFVEDDHWQNEVS
jgi:hypothetical protein